MKCKLTSEVLRGEEKKLIANFASVLVIATFVACVLAGEADDDSTEIDEAQLPFYPSPWDMGNGMNMMNMMNPMFPMNPMMPMIPEMPPVMPPTRPQPVTPRTTTRALMTTTTTPQPEENYPIDYSETFSAFAA